MKALRTSDLLCMQAHGMKDQLSCSCCFSYQSLEQNKLAPSQNDMMPLKLMTCFNLILLSFFSYPYSIHTAPETGEAPNPAAATHNTSWEWSDELTTSVTKIFYLFGLRPTVFIVLNGSFHVLIIATSFTVGRQRRPMKKFTPPPGYEGESSEYSDDDDYSEYSDSDSYT